MISPDPPAAKQVDLTGLSIEHADDVARLHMQGIDTGFLSSLGQGFLRQLYTAIPRCPSGFGYVCTDEHAQVIGFIACSQSTGRLYKEAMTRRGVFMAASVARHLIRPSVVRRMIQTLRYPSQVAQDLPAAEVLSIAVDARARGRGVGRILMDAAMREFRHLRIEQVKVAVWAGNDPANAFYRRCGFTLALTRLHHGLEMNIYTIEVSR